MLGWEVEGWGGGRGEGGLWGARQRKGRWIKTIDDHTNAKRATLTTRHQILKRCFAAAGKRYPRPME